MSGSASTKAAGHSTAPSPLPVSPAAEGRTLPGFEAPSWVQTAQFLMRPTVFMERGWHRYGDMFGARLQGLGSGRMVFVSEPNLIEEVFKGDPSALRAGEGAYNTITPVAGTNSLLVLDAPKHLEDRRLMLPPFHGERMRAYAQVMTEETDRSLAAWPIGSPFPLRPRMAGIALDVIMRAVFGLERGSFYEEMRAGLLDVMESDTAVSLGLMVPAFRRDFGPWRGWSRFQAALAHTDELLYRAIAGRREQQDLEKREDILSMLIVARRKDGTQMTDTELRDELMTLLLAGHETTATGLAWTFDQLFRHPAALARLQEELQGGDEQYLDAVIHEALRVRPVIPFVVRVLKQPMELGGFGLERGTTVVPAIHLVHRREDLYPEPWKFRPERFLDHKPGTYEWLPFGGGTRRCIGASFALFEMRIVLRRVITQAVLEPAGPRERTRRRAFTLIPAHGTPAIRRA